MANLIHPTAEGAELLRVCDASRRACVAAVEALPCTGPTTGDEPLRAARVRGVREVQRACSWVPGGYGAGGGVAVAWDKGAR